MFTHTLQITRQHVSTFLLNMHALKSDFVASCSNFVARITPPSARTSTFPSAHAHFNFRASRRCRLHWRLPNIGSLIAGASVEQNSIGHTQIIISQDFKRIPEGLQV